jgi:hypothetical protein
MIDSRTLRTRLPVLLILLMFMWTGCGVLNEPAGPPRGIPVIPATETVTATIQGCVIIDGKADRDCDPGAKNPEVTQDNIHQTICKPGWSDQVRPDTDVTTPKKLTDMRQYGLDPFADPVVGHMTHREDHLIAITLGGALLDDANLWPQPYRDSVRKDNETRQLRKQVCSGQILLADAQRITIENWTHP